MQSGRILFFSAPCGFGKTALANALLRGHRTLRLCADAPDFTLRTLPKNWDVLLIDDFQLLQEQETSQTLCELIRANPARRFVFLSRGVPPSYLTAFQYTGLMTTLEPDDLLFDREDIRGFFAARKAAVTESEINGILKESIGYPLGVAITARQMSDGKPFSPELTAHTYREVFAYFEAAVYNRFDLPVRRLLLELSLFEDFDMEMVRMVSGDPRAGERMDWLLRHTTMLRYDSRERFHFWAGFRAFLLWEMDREYTEEKRKALFSRGGLYYELKEDYARALECYTQGGDHTRVAELLVRNADLHPGMGHYAEMEKYYRPPQGVYSEENLKLAQALGYRTVFWSLAYVDWYQDDQPTAEQAFSKLLPRIHPGAVVLLHSTSQRNARILDTLLSKWEEMGYSFGTLDELFA